MAATYTTAATVALVLGAADGSGDRLVFDDSGDIYPTLAEVNALIETMEAVINNRTRRSWKEVSVVEYKNHKGFTYDRYGKRSMIVQLLNRDLKTLDTNEGDKIEVYDGSSWTDIIANEGEGAGNGSFFVDYELGKIHFYPSTAIKRGYKTIKMTYRYGASSVPDEIDRATALMVCKQLLQTEHLLLISEADAQFNLSKRDIIGQWDAEIKTIIGLYTRFSMF